MKRSHLLVMLALGNHKDNADVPVKKNRKKESWKGEGASTKSESYVQTRVNDENKHVKGYVEAQAIQSPRYDDLSAHNEVSCAEAPAVQSSRYDVLSARNEVSCAEAPAVQSSRYDDLSARNEVSCSEAPAVQSSCYDDLSARNEVSCAEAPAVQSSLYDDLSARNEVSCAEAPAVQSSRYDDLSARNEVSCAEAPAVQSSCYDDLSARNEVSCAEAPAVQSSLYDDLSARNEVSCAEAPAVQSSRYDDLSARNEVSCSEAPAVQSSCYDDLSARNEVSCSEAPAVQSSCYDDLSARNEVSCAEAPDQSSGFDGPLVYNEGSCVVAPAVQSSRSDDLSVHNEVSCVEAPVQSSGFDDLSVYNGGSCAEAPAGQCSHPDDLPIYNDGSFVESPALQSSGFDGLFVYSEGSCVEALELQSSPSDELSAYDKASYIINCDLSSHPSLLGPSDLTVNSRPTEDFLLENRFDEYPYDITIINEDALNNELTENNNLNKEDEIANRSSTSITHVPKCNSKNSSRTWDRKNFCIYCRTLVTNFCRHLVRWHPTEKEVMELTRISDGNLKERKQKKQVITDELRRRGNFLYNSSKPNDSPFLPTRRLPKRAPTEENNLDFVSCRFCLGMFSRKTFYRHSKKCLKRENPEDLDDNVNSTGIVFGHTKTHGSWKKDGIVMLPLSEDEPHISAFKNNIAPIINKDEYGVIALNDPLILAIGAHFYMNHSDPKDRYNCTKKLRDAAKLLKICRNDQEIIHFSDCFKAKKFNVVMKAVHQLCGVDSETGNVNVVGMPARLSYVIQEGASILICETISNNSLSSSAKELIIKEINDFSTLLKHKWKYMISTNAEKSRKKKLSMKHRILPDDEDIKIVATKIKALELQSYNNLTLNVTPENYEMLCKSVIAHMIILNRRRAGEVARAELQFYLNRPPQEELTDDVMNTLTEEERKTLPLLTVFMVPGKLVHSVPILLTEQMKKSVNLLISCRLPLKIPKSNPLLFARTSTNRPFDGSKILKEIRLTCNLKKPDHMTATGLRHHIATKSQIYGGEKYTENVCQFMGHSSNIHKQNYRIPLQAIQRGQIGYKLLHMEGSTSNIMNIHQSDDIRCNTTNTVTTVSSIEDTAKCTAVEKLTSTTTSTATSSSIAISYTAPPPVKDSDPDYSPEHNSSEDEDLVQINIKKNRTVTSRRKWLDEEKKIVLNELGHCIEERKTPGMSKCLSVLRKHPILASRTWSQLNVFINNYIKGKTKLPNEYSHLLK